MDALVLYPGGLLTFRAFVDLIQVSAVLGSLVLNREIPMYIYSMDHLQITHQYRCFSASIKSHYQYTDAGDDLCLLSFLCLFFHLVFHLVIIAHA